MERSRLLRTDTPNMQRASRLHLGLGKPEANWDDGGGNDAQIGKEDGHDVLGIRKRITALGGRLSIGHAVSPQ
jgi:glucose-6-phosphate-specific signal transduction histidine kinase